MPEHINPRSLVCATCWSSFFSTFNFRSMCQSLEDNDIESPGYTTTIHRVQKSASAGCSWCSLILMAAKLELGPEVVELEITLFKFYSDPSKMGFTPAGKNRSTLFINSKSLMFTTFATEDSEVAEIVTARDLDNKVNSSRVPEQIHKWLIDCDAHEKCRQIEHSVLPSRVIEVNPQDQPDTPRLLATGGMIDYFVALSYCWGLDQPGLTTLSNVESRYQRLDITTLSQTVQDAILTTKRMGIKYLWIDAICIIQDSSDDKNIELASMCKIYQNATVTIVAANAQSAKEGFLKDREPPLPATKIPFWAPDGELVSVSLRLEGRYDDTKEPINARAWTLQEQILSPRLLIYATHTLQYHCQQHTVNLGNSVNVPMGVDQRRFPLFAGPEREGLDAQAAGRVWGVITAMYSERQLSCPEDKLTALAGVAEAFSLKANAEYLAGLWSGALLPRLLMWRVAHGVEYAHPPVYTAPGWSWASLNGGAFYSHFHSGYDYEWFGINAITTSIELENAALRFGRVISGCLKLTGYVRHGRFTRPASVRWTNSECEDEEDPLDPILTAVLDDNFSGERDVICLAIARRTAVEPVIDGLLISPTGNQGAYCRIGCFLGLKERIFEGFSRESVTLV